MSTMGCSYLMLAGAALAVSLVPFLAWIAIAVALPLAIIALAVSGRAALAGTAQPADRAGAIMALALIALVGLRLVLL